MRDETLAGKLRRWLPADAAREWFDPSFNDLRISHAVRPRSSTQLAVETLLVFAQCWGVVFAEALRSRGRVAQKRDRSQEWLPHHKERVPMFLNDLRHAIRMLRREPGFTLAALLTLALGVGANVAVFAVVEAVLLRPLPYPDAANLAIIRHRDTRTGFTKPFIALGDYVDLSQRQQAFESMASYGDFNLTIFGQAEPFKAVGLFAGPGMLEMLGVRPALGRLLRPDDARANAGPDATTAVMIGYDYWQNRFGSDPNIVGRGIHTDKGDVQIVGVAPPGFRFPPDARVDVIAPLPVPPQAPAVRASGWMLSVARLKAGMTLSQAQANLTTLSKQLEREFPRANQGSEYYAIPLRDALVGDTKPALILMFAAVGVVLLIACANVANLLLARTLGRRREMAVRVALGAGQGRLAAQLLAESLVLAGTAGAIGLLFARWGAQALVALVPKSARVPGLADVHLNAGVLAFALSISALTALGFGMLSAISARSTHPSSALGAAVRVSAGRAARRIASAMVVAEVALAIVLLIGAGLILRSFSRLLSVDPGFRIDRVLTMTVAAPRDRYKQMSARTALFDRVRTAVSTIPGVDSVGMAAVIPLTGNNWTVPFERPEHPVPAGERPPDVGWQTASNGFFKALEIPLLSGRLFDDRDRPDSKPVVIISEAIERRFFPGEHAVGRELKLGRDRYEIVGVVGNIRRAGLRDEPRSDMYYSFEQSPSSQFTMFVHATTPSASIVAAVQAAAVSVEPQTTVIDTRTMQEVASNSVQAVTLALWLLGAFSVVALTLAGIGIYGVMSYVVRQRTREIGTRVALGASRGDIVGLVMRQGAVIALIGTAIGLTVGLAATRSLGSLLFGVRSWDPVTLAAASITLIVATMAACYLPARRAARIDPARTLAEQ
jgi:putative ABC transport system permease protein